MKIIKSFDDTSPTRFWIELIAVLLAAFIVAWSVPVFAAGPMRGAVVGAGGAAACTYTLKDSYTGKDDYDHLGNAASRVWVGGKIIAGSGYDLVRFEVGLSKTNSPTFTITGYVYAKSGGGEYPDSTPLGQATATVAASGLSTTNTETYAQFNFSTPITLTNGATYYLVLKTSAYDGSNITEIYHSGTVSGALLVESSDGSSWASIGTFTIDYKTYSCN
jgi:hypothetical protein